MLVAACRELKSRGELPSEAEAAQNKFEQVLSNIPASLLSSKDT